jgi:hypothetical protein
MFIYMYKPRISRIVSFVNFNNQLKILVLVGSPFVQWGPGASVCWMPDILNTMHKSLIFLYARWKRDLLWYGDVRPVLHLPVTLMIMTASVHCLSDD